MGHESIVGMTRMMGKKYKKNNESHANIKQAKKNKHNDSRWEALFYDTIPREYLTGTHGCKDLKHTVCT